MPVNEAGCLIEPPVSAPIVAGVKSAAIAAEDPQMNRLELSLSPTGFITLPKLVSFDEPMRTHPLICLIKAPLSHKFFVTVDSYDGTKLFKILLAVVFVFLYKINL